MPTCTGSCSAAAGWALLAAALLFAAACGLLADWQLHRLAGRHARNDLIRSNLSMRRSAGRAGAGRWPRTRRSPTRNGAGAGHRAAGTSPTSCSSGCGPSRARSASTWSLRWSPTRDLRCWSTEAGCRPGRAAPALPRGAGTTGGTVTVTGRLRPTEPPHRRGTTARPDHPHRRTRHRPDPSVRRLRRLPRADPPGARSRRRRRGLIPPPSRARARTCSTPCSGSCSG